MYLGEVRADLSVPSKFCGTWEAFDGSNSAAKCLLNGYYNLATGLIQEQMLVQFSAE